ncbi:MAG: hypothetical protein ACOCUT_00750 [bacterium]
MKEQDTIANFLKVQKEELFDWKTPDELREHLWNWYLSSLTEEGRQCSTMTLTEQAWLYERLKNLIDDLEMLTKIIKT